MAVWWVPELLACAIALLAALLYTNSLDAEWTFDDHAAVVSNPDVMSRPLGSPGLFRNDFWGTPLSTATSHQSYRPLTTLSFRANAVLGGKAAGRHWHVVSVAAHALACALYAIVARCVVFGGEPRLQRHVAAAALAFAVHPVHVEAVASIVGRADVLAGVCFLLVLLCHHRAALPAATPCRSAAWIAAAVALALAALLCKETGVTALGVCTALELARWFVPQRVEAPRSRARALALALALAALCAARLALSGGRAPTFSAAQNPAAYAPRRATRVMSRLHIWALTARQLFAPPFLCADWSMGGVALVTSWRDPRNGALLALALAAACATRALWRRGGRERAALCAALALLAIPFAPSANVLVNVGFVVAERVLYIPSMGACALLPLFADAAAGALASLAARARAAPRRQLRLQRALWSAIVLSFVVRGALQTVARNPEWRSDEALARSGALALPSNAKLSYNLAVCLTQRSTPERDAAALRAYEAALAAQPDYAAAHLGAARIYEGRFFISFVCSSSFLLFAHIFFCCLCFCLRRGSMKTPGAPTPRSARCAPRCATTTCGLTTEAAMSTGERTWPSACCLCAARGASSCCGRWSRRKRPPPPRGAPSSARSTTRCTTSAPRCASCPTSQRRTRPSACFSTNAGGAAKRCARTRASSSSSTLAMHRARCPGFHAARRKRRRRRTALKRSSISVSPTTRAARSTKRCGRSRAPRRSMPATRRFTRTSERHS